MTKLILSFLIVALICALLLIRPQQTQAADTCPNINTAWTAQLDILGSGGVHYLIDPLSQGLPSHIDNVANLQYASNPNRWLINGVKVAPTWSYKYHISYWNQSWQSAGEVWFATHPANKGVYFYFVMPANETDHPRCGYGSVKQAYVDELLKVRK